LQLKDKVVVITGAGSGIGAGCARGFAAEGAHVVLVDIGAAEVQVVAQATGGAGLAADMTREADVRAVASLALSTYGRVDLWFSNAGISSSKRPGQIPGDEEWDRMWRLHVMAHVYAARAVLPSMLGRGDGYLLQTVSRVALAVHPGKAAYSVTKHASLALGEWLAIHYRPRGIKVSCFCPGAMRTPMLLANDFAADDPVLRRALSPEQVAHILVAGIAEERFLILTPDSSVRPLAMRAKDYEAWLDSYSPGGPDEPPPDGLDNQSHGLQNSGGQL
jgi:NAD(P)-dependent dehydrogenase (short-subunit alcohol dehydrogenase family)